MAIRLTKLLGIFSIALCILTFVKEDAAALESGDNATSLFVQSFDVSDQETAPRGLTFNNDGSKMYIIGTIGDDVNEYNLSTNFDVSTASFVDSYSFMTPTQDTNLENSPMSVKFNNDGTKMFIVGTGSNNVNEFILTTAYDVSTASHETSFSVADQENNPFGLDFNNDGTKMFITGATGGGTGAEDINEYSLNVGFDLSEGVNFVQLKTLADIGLRDPEVEPFGIEFNPDGTTMFIIGTKGNDVLQYALSTGFDVSTISFVGGLHVHAEESNPSGIAFSPSGLRMFITGTKDGGAGVEVNEYHLSCPFNLFSGKCPSITKNKDRTGIAEAQIMIAKRTIDHSTQSALHRLEWIRRNKDNQNLTNLNNFNTVIQFDNPLLNYWVKKFPDKLVAVNEEAEGGRSITIGREYKKRNRNSNKLDDFTTTIKSDNPLLNSWMDKLPEKITAHQASAKKKTKDKKQVLNSWMDKLLEKITARQASAKKKTKDKKQDLFFWSEGSIAVGRVGDTSVSSTKKIGTEAITLGVDKFTNNDEIKGFAFRIGNNNIDVGTAGSNLDTDTFNLTYYATSPVENDTKFIDTIIGFGKLKSDLLTVLDSKNLTADRTGNQLYGTIKIKDEIKKDNLILIPSYQVDVGQTILDGYTESGNGAIDVKKQNVRTLKLRTAIAMVEDLLNDKYTFKRHGKLEYVADIERSSNFKYTYVSDDSTSFKDSLHTGALHNLNGEIGFDIIFPDYYSMFAIYERSHAFGSGYTDSIHIALGYLPHKDTKYSFSVGGSDNLMSQFEIKKNINEYDFSFNSKNDLTNLGNDQELSINLKKVF